MLEVAFILCLIVTGVCGIFAIGAFISDYLIQPFLEKFGDSTHGEENGQN